MKPRAGLAARLLSAAAGLAALPFAAFAQAGTEQPPAPPVVRLEPVVVTATRTEQSPFDVPASIDRIGGEGIRSGRPQVNLSESLGGVPGLLARDRQNYAQDVQISLRGFGARSTFGIRGVRLYVDGIPATLPDGQGQITNVELGSTDRIEVLRGPFSALYGNSSGGVIQVFSEEGSGPPVAGISVTGGSDGTLRFGVKASGRSDESGAGGGLRYVLGASRFTTDGYRDHSAAERRIGNVKLTLKPDPASTLSLVANTLSLPKALDPLGLTRAQFEADPRGVDPSAELFDTRKTVDQTQAGIVYERRIDAGNALRVLVYGGHRSTEQYQSIPVATQANPLHPGGVIDLGRDYRGTDWRWTTKTELADRPLTLVGGLAYDALSEHRRGYQSFVGTVLGVQGALRRDEDNDVFNFDQYLQGTWQVADRWRLSAGVRHSSVHFSSDDSYVIGANPDDSGSKGFSATLPVAGLVFSVNEAVHVYAAAGRGFETPTLNELAYRPSGATGLNLALRSSTNRSFELGVKTRSALWGNVDAALFETRTDDEIVTQTNVGGRSTFQNGGTTRRRGLEAAWSRDLGGDLHDLRARLAYTLLDARYRDAFATCNATPCPTATFTVAAGNRIPGIARQSLYGELGWAPPVGWRGGVEARALSRVWVNDANSDAAGGFAVAAVNLGYVARVQRWELSGFARVDNLFDRRYAGSVIVGEGNGRYFEPAPGRTWTAGASAAYAF